MFFSTRKMMTNTSTCSSSSSSSSLPILTLFLVVTTLTMLPNTTSYSAKLSTNFYRSTCPELFTTVESVVKSAISKEKRMGASLLRLFFHDCFVQGCDASILLDDTPSFRGEKTAGPNNNSVRGFEVIDEIKSKVKNVCPGVVSCADILAIAARDSVVILGGPNWKVKLGRRDSKTASFSGANSGQIPPPTSSLSNLVKRFKAVGLSEKDMVALSGAHTIGKARCISFRSRIYNETDTIDSSFAKKRQATCPRGSGKGDNNLAPLDVQSPTLFDNKYYKNLMKKKGLLHSDQVLYNGGSSSTDSLVEKYSKDTQSFEYDFVTAMIRMGDNGPLTGSNGIIRRNCRKIN